MGVYSCPYCFESDLDYVALRTHCNEAHKNDEKQMVCPICAGMPWGITFKIIQHKLIFTLILSFLR